MRDREREFIRRYLGMTKLLELMASLQVVPLQLERLEKKMATAKDQINELSAKVDDLAADVRAGRGNLDPEAQEALTALTDKVKALDEEVGDADGSDTAQTPEAPVEDDGSTPSPFS